MEELDQGLVEAIREYQKKLPFIGNEHDTLQYIEEFTKFMQCKTQNKFYKMTNINVIEKKYCIINFWQKENHIVNIKGNHIQGRAMSDGKRILVIKSGLKNGKTNIYLSTLVNSIVNGFSTMGKKNVTFTKDNKSFLLHNAFADKLSFVRKKSPSVMPGEDCIDISTYTFVKLSSSSLAQKLIGQSDKAEKVRNSILSSEICKEGVILSRGKVKNNSVFRGVQYVTWCNVKIPVHKLLAVVFMEEAIEAYEKRISKCFSLFGPTEINVMHIDNNKSNNALENLKLASHRMMKRTQKRRRVS